MGSLFSQPRRLFFFLWPFLLVGILWSLDTVSPGNLDSSGRSRMAIPALEHPWLYALLHLFTVIPVLALSFDKKVHYYTSWGKLLPATLIMLVWFILWDAYFGYVGVWGFNEAYLLGGRILGLPWEEWLFFVTVPFGSFFIYRCLNVYFPTDPLKQYDSVITIFLIVALLLLGVLHIGRLYTATTFFLTGGFLLYHYLYFPNTYRTLFYRSFLVILIPFLLVNGALTGAFTESPVVVYNPEEFMGLRIVTIPFEDSVYGFLHLFGLVYWYHRLESRKGEGKQ